MVEGRRIGARARAGPWPRLSLSSGRFLSYLGAVFLTAFNDNLFRWSVVFHLLKGQKTEEAGQMLLAVTGTCFILPFVLLSPPAGILADRFSKRRVLVLAKAAEVLVMAAALFAVDRSWFLYPLIFLMGAQSAFFGPGKYGIIAEIVDESRLVRANSWVQFGTIVAILTGTFSAGLLMEASGLGGAIRACLGVAVLGWLLSLGIPKVPAANPARTWRWFPHAEVLGSVRRMRRVPNLLTTLGAVTGYWLVAFFFSLTVTPYAKFVLRVDQHFGEAALLTMLSYGTIGGCIVIATLKHVRLSTGWMPIGALGLGVTALVLGLSVRELDGALWAMTVLGFFAGVYVVPVQAHFQHLSPPEDRGSNMATMNFFSFAGMLLGGGLLMVLTRAGMGATDLFIGMGGAILALAAVQVLLMPETIMWLAIYLLINSLYRLKVRGRENVPRKGGLIVAANHVSLVDAFFLMVAIPRPIRFMLDRNYHDHWFLKPFCRAVRTIPVPGGGVAKEAIARGIETVRAGEVLGIFPEGMMTRTGNMNRFRGGVEKIARETGAPILPVHLDGVWGSLFSLQGDRFKLKRPGRLPWPVTVTIGGPMPPETPAFALRQRVQELGAGAFRDRMGGRGPIPVEWVRAAKRWRRRTAMADSTGIHLSYGQALLRSHLLAGAIRRRCAGQEMIGILLPPTVGAALSNLAVLMTGKIPVNLNWTAPREAVESAIRRCGISTVLTAKPFLKKIGYEHFAAALPLEELAREIGPGAKVRGWLACTLLPCRLLVPLIVDPRMRRNLDGVCTVIFSSGSTGEPKGVVLSHENVLANVLGIADVIRTGRNEGMAGILPFFHALGFTGTLCLPLLLGIRVAYHPNPLDVGGVGKLAADHRLTILISTPRFLQTYVRRMPAEQLRTLRHVISGAEKLPESLAVSFRERFGLEPREGYGATELAPVVSLNTPDFEGKMHQPGTRRGTVGRPIPGVAVRIVDPETGEAKGPGEEGLILVRGPNLMRGYLKDPEGTAGVMRNGWYVTGDIGKVDEDGFLSVTDRLSRFSKIGGEMVPHALIEEALHRVLGVQERCCVVTAVPEGERGERLVVVHVPLMRTPEELVSALRRQGLPNLWIPKANAFKEVASLPLLGSGKVDLRAVRAIARSCH